MGDFFAKMSYLVKTQKRQAQCTATNNNTNDGEGKLLFAIFLFCNVILFVACLDLKFYSKQYEGMCQREHRVGSTSRSGNLNLWRRETYDGVERCQVARIAKMWVESDG